MKNKIISIVCLAVFLISAAVLLRYEFDFTNSTIASILLMGLMGGLVYVLFTGFILPPTWLFKARFVLFGASFGLFIGLVNYSAKVFQFNGLGSYELIICILIYLIMGLLIMGSMTYLRYNLLKKKAKVFFVGESIVSDFAILKDGVGKQKQGLLLMLEDRLLFYSSKEKNCLLEVPLSKITLNIKKSKYLNIPNGLSLGYEELNLYMAFPYYWKKLINDDRR